MPKQARAYWKGFLRLSLVSIPVEIYNAVESKSEISFRQIHKPSGRRISYEKVVPGVGKVENSDIVKGYEVDTDTYITLEPEEVDAVKLDSKKTIDIAQFVDVAEIDWRYFERPYYIVPGDEIAGEGYAVIREAMRKTGKAGIAQVTIGGREWLVAVAPLGDGLVMVLLRYADELRNADDYFDEIPKVKPDKEMVDLAAELIGRKTSAFDPSKYEDHYATALKALIKDKLKGRRIVAYAEEERPKGTNVVDLMEALRRSVGGGKKTPAKAAPKEPKRRSKPKPSGRRAS
ncbi:MAG: Ku protein [Alphaproteobacteria bacterium 64-6]|nr:Ku protein [Hyphomicrobium sp.]OJU28702.1 MAG: Ku protein [Alphaproteobacteria bacterium 64-6]